MSVREKIQSYSYSQAQDGYGDSTKVEFDLVLNGYDITMGTVSKFFQASQDQMLGDSRIGAGGFSWSDYSLGSNVHSAKFAGMNASGVVSTWSWSSPSENFFTGISNDGHAVSGFDFIDTIPADGVFLDGVRNGYTLIEDRDFGFINYEVNNATEKGGPDEGHYRTADAAAKPRLNIQSEYQYENYPSANGAGLGSKDFGITSDWNTSIGFGHGVIVAYESGDLRG